ncbi:MAG: DUF4418 family protein [Oscillospiraceae bacterium]|nr:DUF4418 family protein [Oscillospiraceae bacterium]
MKNKITAIGTVIMGALLALGPQFLFQPCPTTEKFMKCFWSCKALIVVGAVLALIGLLQLLSKEAKSRKVLSIVGLALAVCAILIPTVIIGGCAKPEMACKMLTFPVTHSLSAIAIVLQGLTLISKE